MAVPPIPPPLAQLGRRRFSFYPAILKVKHNEWTYHDATWSEVLVRNADTNEVIAVPRRYLGEISRVDAPVMIVGLLKELEYRAGAAWPAERRVIEMPRAVNDSPRPPRTEAPATLAPVIGIRLESSYESRLVRVALAGIALGVVGVVLAISLYRGGVIATRAFYAPVFAGHVDLTSHDDYSSVVRKLGTPAHERWHNDYGERQYQLLAYPQRGLYVILMGFDRTDARYIGSLNRAWHPVHTVELAGYGNSYALLKHLPRF
jgi:hypothetical protein